ncbi:hypothetical protein HDU92_007138 [Lobulomyces angularis]|nr:hypothetical protein HDU92_007138 [Lobulomyces angularis]
MQMKIHENTQEWLTIQKSFGNCGDRLKPPASSYKTLSNIPSPPISPSFSMQSNLYANETEQIFFFNASPSTSMDTFQYFEQIKAPEIPFSPPLSNPDIVSMDLGLDSLTDHQDTYINTYNNQPVDYGNIVNTSMWLEEKTFSEFNNASRFVSDDFLYIEDQISRPDSTVSYYSNNFDDSELLQSILQHPVPLNHGTFCGYTSPPDANPEPTLFSNITPIAYTTLPVPVTNISSESVPEAKTCEKRIPTPAQKERSSKTQPKLKTELKPKPKERILKKTQPKQPKKRIEKFSSKRVVKVEKNNQNEIPTDKSQEIFPCPICDKIFIRSYNLKSHMVCHSGEKLHGCIWRNCGKSFARKHDLLRHQKNLHKLY